MKMFLQGRWKDKSETIDVKNPLDQTVLDTVPAGHAADVDAALTGAVVGAAVMRKVPAYDRAKVL